MESLAEQLCHAGVSSTHATRYLRQVRAFRAQLQTAFAPADAARILDALELMVELHLDQAPRPDGTPYIEHPLAVASQDRKSTRLNSSHQIISYAVFCLKKKKTNIMIKLIDTDTRVIDKVVYPQTCLIF